jgi:hypothetical protein
VVCGGVSAERVRLSSGEQQRSPRPTDNRARSAQLTNRPPAAVVPGQGEIQRYPQHNADDPLTKTTLRCEFQPTFFPATLPLRSPVEPV